MCFSRKHQLFFVMSSDFKTHVFNLNMILVCEIQMKKMSLIHHA